MDGLLATVLVLVSLNLAVLLTIGIFTVREKVLDYLDSRDVEYEGPPVLPR